MCELLHERQLGTSVVQALVLYSLAEFQSGHCGRIRVETNGRSFSVEDDGRGHAIERTVAGHPYLRYVYTHFDFPFAPVAPPLPAVQLQGIGMSLINALCSELAVIVRKPTKELHLLYRDGCLREERELQASSAFTGTAVAGLLVPDITVASEPALRSWFETIKRSAPTLQLSVNGQVV